MLSYSTMPVKKMNLQRCQLLKSKCVKFCSDIETQKNWLSRTVNGAFIKSECHGSCRAGKIAQETSKARPFFRVRMFCQKKKKKHLIRNFSHE